MNITNDPKYIGLVDSYEQCFLAMGIMMEKKMSLPVLILIYSVIDSFGWLAATNPREKVKERFCKWLDRWLFSSYDFPYNAIDLYAARCAVLHTLTYKSDLIARGKARPIAYAYGGAKKELLESVIDPQKECIVVNIEELIQAVKNTGANFLIYASRNPQVSKRLLDKSTLFFNYFDESFNLRRYAME